MELKKILEKRRSIYNIGNDLPISEDEVTTLVKDLTELVPDAFDMKSARVIILFNEKHHFFWDTVFNIFDGKISREKIESFKSGAGTILYFYDKNVVQVLQEKFPLYAQNFPIWANQANGMLQFTIWSGLAEKGIGANLQHYNPVIDKKIKEIFNIPESYEFVAQMPFGNIKLEAPSKAKENIDTRVIVIKN
ncbi:nitroreductase family protein [uncultured Fusobacterium sp.]|uniref:nitroreductase family protein n=1 Tax=uncultured Fusobacterium sp. TaxID=159267 RepID=UPI0025E69DBF|nr:nitroreductase family protein [uncultured Fusobacterium sp.]